MSEPMDQQASDLTALNNLYKLNSVLQGMLLNINLIEAGTIGKVLTVTNANLFQIAAVEYGDANQWTTIANANGLTDPMIEATLTAIVNASPSLTTVTLNGIPASPQNITLNVNGISYTYNVSVIDTLNSIASNIALLFSSDVAVAVDNAIIYAAGVTVSSNVIIQRIVNLVIPQQAGLPSGGILSS